MKPMTSAPSSDRTPQEALWPGEFGNNLRALRELLPQCEMHPLDDPTRFLMGKQR